MITFKRTAAALAFAAFLAPGVSLADNCVAQPESIGRCIVKHYWGPLSQDLRSPALAKLDRYIQKQVAAHPWDALDARTYAQGGRVLGGHGRIASDVVTDAQLADFSAAGRFYFRACMAQGISFAFFATDGCQEFSSVGIAYRDQLVMLGRLASELRKLAETTETTAAQRAGLAAVERDFVAAAHRAQLSGYFPAGLLVATPDATLFERTASRTLRNLALPTNDSKEYSVMYAAELKRELAGLPLDDWRNPAAGAK